MNFKEYLNEGKPIEDAQALINQRAKIHPVVKDHPTHEDYMKWSIHLLKGGHVGDARTLYMGNECMGTLSHIPINKSIRNTDIHSDQRAGRKRPIILVEGTIIDINFDDSRLHELLSAGGWHSVTYNPHKFDEYVYRESLPDWWCKDDRFIDTGKRDASSIEKRTQAQIERFKENYPYKILSKRTGDKSYFKCEEILIKQHVTCDEDYMWVKGVYY